MASPSASVGETLASAIMRREAAMLFDRVRRVDALEAASAELIQRVIQREHPTLPRALCRDLAENAANACTWARLVATDSRPAERIMRETLEHWLGAADVVARFFGTAS